MKYFAGKKNDIKRDFDFEEFNKHLNIIDIKDKKSVNINFLLENGKIDKA